MGKHTKAPLATKEAKRTPIINNFKCYSQGGKGSGLQWLFLTRNKMVYIIQPADQTYNAFLQGTWESGIGMWNLSPPDQQEEHGRGKREQKSMKYDSCLVAWVKWADESQFNFEHPLQNPPSLTFPALIGWLSR